jgi:hypothetical protein
MACWLTSSCRLPVIGRAEASTRLTWNHKSVTILKVDGMSTAIPQMTFDWTADSANGWTIPIGADVGEAFNVRSHAMSLQLGAYDLAKRPTGAPQWIIRMQLTALFPT